MPLKPNEITEALEILSFFFDAKEVLNKKGKTPSAPDKKIANYPQQRDRLCHLINLADTYQKDQVLDLEEYPIEKLHCGKT